MSSSATSEAQRSWKQRRRSASDTRSSERACARNYWLCSSKRVQRDVASAEFAHALARRHGGMRQIAMPARHCTDRVADAQHPIANRARTPGLAEADRALLDNTLRDLRGAESGVPCTCLVSYPVARSGS